MKFTLQDHRNTEPRESENDESRAARLCSRGAKKEAGELPLLWLLSGSWGCLLQEKHQVDQFYSLRTHEIDNIMCIF